MISDISLEQSAMDLPSIKHPCSELMIELGNGFSLLVMHREISFYVITEWNGAPVFK